MNKNYQNIYKKVTKQTTHTVHDPVLLTEVLDVLKPQKGERYLDVTAGYGGHAAAVLAQTGNSAGAVLVDRDENAINYLQQRFGDAVVLKQQDFATASRELAAEGATFDLILADLGVSSPHLDNAERGFAIRSDGPLDMRMDTQQELSAATLLNSASEAVLIDILQRYGEEPKAAAIARKIIARRPLRTTSQLAALVREVWPGHSRVHPATRTFQAIRIAVNDELGQLESSLPKWQQLLAPGGRLAVISFHSLEDRIVKQYFAEHAGDRYDATLRILTKRPLVASATEAVLQPRARSAKLRAAAKIKNKKGN